MAEIKTYLRVTFALLIVLPSVGITAANANDIFGSPEADIQQPTNDNNSTASTIPLKTESKALTVVTNHYDSSKHGSIAVFDQNGDLVYKNESHNRYFDVDPVPNTTHTVEYVGSDVLNSNVCNIPEKSNFNCIRNVVERMNLSTGKVNRIYTYEVVTRHHEDSIHDVDRLNDTHLLVGDIFKNRAYIVNTSSELITWSWHAKNDFSFNSGGNFRDWTHLNDVEYIEEKNVIMADLRNHDQVVFIHRTRGLLENWTIGADDDYDVLYEQHNPDYIPEYQGGPAVVIADSENNRIVEYQRENGTWNESWTWSDIKMEWPRDADRLPNGHTLITDTHSNRVLEVNQSGEIVWQISYPKAYEAERLATGDESAGGESAASLGLESTQDQNSESSRDSVDSEVKRVPVPANAQTGVIGTDGVKDLLYRPLRAIYPNKVYHGLKWVLPSWMGIFDITAVLLALLSALSWVCLEIYWTDKLSVRSPLVVKP